MTKRCLYCKKKYKPDPNSEYQTKYEGCPECEKRVDDFARGLVHEIVSTPMEIRKTWELK